MDWDVIIIGGGVAGLSCALTIASAHTKTWFENRQILVLDDGRSDLNKAMLNNVPGVEPGTTGAQALVRMREQIESYPVATVVTCEVQRLDRVGTGAFDVRCADGTRHRGRHLVIATGYKRRPIDGLPVEPVPHALGGKPNRIMLPHDGAYRLDADLHVAGLLAGGSSQFAIAAGTGAQVAVDLLSAWAGKRTHVHETVTSSRS